MGNWNDHAKLSVAGDVRQTDIVFENVEKLKLLKL